MKELQEIQNAVRILRGRSEEAVLATVVEVRGSTYRRTGARLLLNRHGWIAGGISGGCLEGDVLRKAWWHTEESGYALVTYDSTADEEDEMAWGLGLGCNGIVRVLLERLSCEKSETEPHTFLSSCLASRQAGAFATIYEAPDYTAWVGQRVWHNAAETGGTVSNAALRSALITDAPRILAERRSQNKTYTLANGEMVSVFWEAVIPPTPLVIYGAGQDTLPVIRFAKELGWHVTVVAPRTSTNATVMARRFSGADAVVSGLADDVSGRVSLDADTAVLLMTHQYFDDLALLPEILRSPARYVGVLGPRKRAERILAELARCGESFTEDMLRKLHAPVGLDIGADTPEEIALSAISEIKAVMTGRSGGALRERADSIHQRAETEEQTPLLTMEKVTCLLATT